MGQLPQGVVNQAAQSVVQQAEPKVRSLLAEERLRIAQAGKTALPLIALSAVGFFATSYWAKTGKVRVAGYVASAGALGIGLWLGFDALKGDEPEPVPTAETPSLPFVSEAARQMAKAIVDESLPVIQELVGEERARLGGALTTTLPYMAAGIAGGLLTFFAVPEGSVGFKVAGYTASAAAALVGLWHGLETVSA